MTITFGAAALSAMIDPYGGELVDLLVRNPDAQAELRARAAGAPSVRLSLRSLCDLELLATGAFSPLTTFMGEADYRAVLTDMRLADGTLFPIPITLPLPDDVPVRPGHALALRDPRNALLAVLTVEDMFSWDRTREARAVCGTTDEEHTLVAEMASWAPRYATGALQVLGLPRHHSFGHLRLTPVQTRAALARLGRSRIVAFQTRNPLHRVHEELTKRAACQVDGSLLIHPVVGQTTPGDVDVYTRVRCYEAILARRYDAARTVLGLVPLAMRMAGPREALWHAIIRRNYGATHLIVGRDHAGPKRKSGRPFYGPSDAQTLVRQHEEEIGIQALPFEELVYLPEEDRYEPRSRAGNRAFLAISGTQVREQYLATGRPLPEWFTRPEVAAVLADVARPRQRQGFCVWLTGLSGAGKSTIADILAVRLLERGRRVTTLDGDVVRTHLSKGLGFSREDRDTNVARIGFVAAEIVRHGGIVICPVLSPYRDARARVRETIGAGQFILVHVATPLAVCEQRDAKGLYAQARRGRIARFTGIDDPYEAPLDPDISLDTTGQSPEECAMTIVRDLIRRGLLADGRADAPEPSWM